MGLPSSRFMLFHRLVLLPPLVLLTLTCLYTSSTLSPFGTTHHLSFSQDVQCFSCESSASFPSRSFLSLANFPASSYIRDIVLRHNVLNVEDSRGERASEPVSRRDANEVASIFNEQISNENTGPDKVVDDPHLEITRRVNEEATLPIASRLVDPQEASVEGKPIQQDKAAEEVPARVKESTNPSRSDDKPAEENEVDRSLSRDNANDIEEKVDNSASSTETQVDYSAISDSNVESPVPEDTNGDSSVQYEEFSSETKENFEGSKKEDVDSSVPEGKDVDSSVQAMVFFSETKETSESIRKEGVDSFVRTLDFSSETKDNSESNGKEDIDGSRSEDKNVDTSMKIVGFSSKTMENFQGDKRDDFQLENRHLTSDDDGGPDEHVETPIEANVSITGAVPAPASPLEEKEVMRFRHENISEEVETAGIAVQKLMDAITKSGLPTESLNSTDVEDPNVNLFLRGGSPQGVPLSEERSCEGRNVFVYNLPAKFNVDLVGQCDKLLRWFNFCDYFMNEGMGTNVSTDEVNDKGEKVLVPDGSWFLTHQYALELIFHARLKYYPCLTTDVNQADLFFVPYYAGLDVIRWHFQANVSNDQRDELTFELMSWLQGQETWSRNNGIDHVFVLGKIGWDFRRATNTGHWGSKLLRLPVMWKPTKVLIERDPWHNHDIGVPHPTFFHPKDDNEIRTWLAHVEQSERRYLVSFAGMPRPNMLGNVRGHLIQQCLDHPDDCFLLRCVANICLRPDSTMNLFLHSHFCMQPPGDSPTRRSVFDSLVGGCIPVLFDPYTAYYQYPWHLPRNASSYSVFIPSPDVMSGKSDIVEILKSISPEERTAMRSRVIREIIPGLLYSQPGTKHSDFRDAFDISIEALLHRVANLRAQKKSM